MSELDRYIEHRRRQRQREWFDVSSRPFLQQIAHLHLLHERVTLIVSRRSGLITVRKELPREVERTIAHLQAVLDQLRDMAARVE